MKTKLEEIKNEYAQLFRYNNWTDFINDQPNYCVEHHMNKICEIYAKECSQASLEEASKNACIEPKGMMTRVDKESITDPDNIILL